MAAEMRFIRGIEGKTKRGRIIEMKKIRENLLLKQTGRQTNK
jgi:hypothetical protein